MVQEQILVVDDEKSTLELARKILGREGYATETASSGEEAEEIFENRRFDLLLTDVRMPGVDGIDLLHRFKMHSPDTAAVVFSGHGTLDMAMDAISRGSDGFILKPFSSSDLVNAVRVALDKSKMLRENIRLKSIMPLFDVSKKLVTKVKTDELFNYLVRVALRESHSDTASIMTISPDGYLEIRAAHGLANGFTQNRIKVGEGLAGQVAETGLPLILNSDSKVEHLQEMMTRDQIASAIIIPISIDNDIKGVINVTRLKGGRPSFSDGDVDFMAILADQAAVAIDNARLVEGLNELFMSTVHVLSRTIDMKSKWTAGHSERVTSISMKIGRQLKLSQPELTNLEVAGLLHDIGKIGTYELLLDKPGKLTDEEFEKVKLHSSAGYELLSPVKQLEKIAPIIRHHHERYDGKGYPDGLNGNEIPLLSRILTVADSFDAMHSDRPYKNGMPIPMVIDELKSCAGSQFDPLVVNGCVELFEQAAL